MIFIHFSFIMPACFSLLIQLVFIMSFSLKAVWLLIYLFLISFPIILFFTLVFPSSYPSSCLLSIFIFIISF